MIRFASWWFLLLIPIAVFLLATGRKRRGLTFSSVKLLKSAGRSRTIKHKIGKGLVLCGVVLALVALARPQTAERTEAIRQQGIDIAMLLDVSGSMASVDFKPNRLEVARQTMDDFIASRKNDRLALVVFAGEAYTRIPLTLDHTIVRQSLADVTMESVGQDGTAIGMAISVGMNRLKKSDAQSRVMILITDGDNNAGTIDPLTASQLAAELGIRVYTIGIGSDTLIIPVQSFGQTMYQHYDGNFDETLLAEIADATGGQYFRAADAGALEQVFDTINQLEKTEFEDENFKTYTELAFPLMAAAVVLLAVGVILDKYTFLQIP